MEVLKSNIANRWAKKTTDGKAQKGGTPDTSLRL
jgi:hypothetical protein